MTKHKQIKQHLLDGKSITGLIALQEYGVYRLSSVINRLRNEGLSIRTIQMKSIDGATMFAKYFLDKS